MFEFIKLNQKFDDVFIKEINKIINKDIKDTEGYRKVKVFIRGTDYIPPEAVNIPNLMHYFIDNYNNYPIEYVFNKISKFHIEFERIHPFEDGNGRTGRMLINYELIKNNLAPIVIEKEDRIKYFEFLRNQDIKNLSNWFKDLSERENERMNNFL